MLGPRYTWPVSTLLEILHGDNERKEVDGVIQFQPFLRFNVPSLSSRNSRASSLFQPFLRFNSKLDPVARRELDEVLFQPFLRFNPETWGLGETCIKASHRFNPS